MNFQSSAHFISTPPNGKCSFTVVVCRWSVVQLCEFDGETAASRR